MAIGSERDLIKGYWESYSKWQLDAGKESSKSINTAKASLAVQGIGEESPIYQSMISRLNKDYDINKSSIEAGQTKASLTKYFEQDKKTYTDYLNRSGGSRLTPGRRAPTPDYAGATDEERSLVAQLDKGPGYSEKYSRTPRSKEKKEKWEGLLAQKDDLITARNEQGLEDFYTQQFGLGNETPYDYQGDAERLAGGQRKRAAGAQQSRSSPWW